jgi:hypothetical protein
MDTFNHSYTSLYLRLSVVSVPDRGTVWVSDTCHCAMDMALPLLQMFEYILVYICIIYLRMCVTNKSYKKKVASQTLSISADSAGLRHCMGQRQREGM